MPHVETLFVVFSVVNVVLALVLIAIDAASARRLSYRPELFQVSMARHGRVILHLDGPWTQLR